MKIPHICLFLCANLVAIVMAYYRRCFDSFSLCLIANTIDDSYKNWNSKFRLGRRDAIDWCLDQSSSLAFITNDTVQSAVKEFIKDPSAKMLDSDVVTSGFRSDRYNWEWVNERKSAIYPSSNGTHRYVYLTVSPNRTYSLSDGPSTWKMKFICSYITQNTNCSSGFRQMGSRCYKIYEREATWFAARNICLKEESDLATFEDGISSLPSELFGRYWIGLRKERWAWVDTQTLYGEVKYSNWEDNYPYSSFGDSLCLKARTGKWINCAWYEKYRYICIQDFASGWTSTATTQRTRLTTATPKVNVIGFLPIIGIGIVCLLILIIYLAAVVFIKNRRRFACASRSGDHEPTNENFPPPMTYKDEAPNTVYALADVNCLPKENMNGRPEDSSEYHNIQMMTDSVYANSAKTKV